jgi:4-aminobutyrate aminotransferase/(S)-3-amino-2-methylpropionate transaminase
MDAAHAGGLGGTFGGNPVATAAAIAVFDAIESRGLLAEAERIEKTLKPELLRLQAAHDIIGEVRGMGAMIAVEFVQAGTAATTKVPNATAVSAISRYAFEHGLILLTAGTNGNIIRFLPSLAISDAQLLDAVSVIEDALSTL